MANAGSEIMVKSYPRHALWLVALPTILAVASRSATAAAFATAVLLLLMSPIRTTGRAFLVQPHVICLALVIALIICRPNYPAVPVQLVFIALAIAASVRAVQLAGDRATAFIAILDGVGIYLLASVVLYLAGMRSSAASGRSAGLENGLTGMERVIFPLSNSLATTPALAAVFIVGAAALVRRDSPLRKTRIAAIVLAIAMLVLSEARLVLFAAPMLGLVALFVPQLLRTLTPIITIAAAALPFVYPSVQSLVAESTIRAEALLPNATRAGEEVGSLNQRDFIWSRSISFIESDATYPQRFFGSGMFGHAASGGSKSYYPQFDGLGRDASLMTPHSTAVQILFDAGFVGSVLMLVAVLGVVFTLRKQPGTRPAQAAQGMIAALMIASTTEVTLSVAHAQLTWWVFVMIVAAAGLKVPSPLAHTPAPTASRRTIPSEQIKLSKVLP
ncbi:O-antigen ligase family protein [Rhodococcus sp. 06-1460-1B]|uniref:O-antigen ligase family protein n=1 Tax=Rhodococcus sp. 06-1460-1B TaxID=2022501 RepID=UPI000B9B0BAF|nr:O-antigen ligase family protein [Rhodococcus sp. 06-1460-1B]OZD63130.1 hypothetical protein CH268_09300 [Rhodococcus sp. 06-1460-1B]